MGCGEVEASKVLSAQIAWEKPPSIEEADRSGMSPRS